MPPIDWHELYAANRASIARAGITPSGLPNLQAHPVLPQGVAMKASDSSGRVVDQARTRPLVHVPLGLDVLTPAPLVCMLHGCTQDPSTFAAATVMNAVADRHGFLVLYPGQDRGANAQGCWNWFLPEHQRRGSGEPAAIAALVRSLMAPNSRFTVDPQRIFVAGLSSGGAMAVILAACYPDIFAGVAAHSGLAYRSASSIASAFQVMAHGSENSEDTAVHAAMGSRARPLPSIVIHGTADRTVAPSNARQLLRQLMTANHLASPASCEHDPAHPTTSSRGGASDGHPYTTSRWIDLRGRLMHELIEVDDLAHAWSGGMPGGSYTDPRGPSATEAIWTFFASAQGGSR